MSFINYDCFLENYLAESFIPIWLINFLILSVRCNVVHLGMSVPRMLRPWVLVWAIYVFAGLDPYLKLLIPEARIRSVFTPAILKNLISGICPALFIPIFVVLIICLS